MIDKWYNRLKSFVPSWLFSSEGKRVESLFRAMASILATAEQTLLDHISQTKIDTAEGQFLDLIGEGRGIVRHEGEIDQVYRERVRNINNNSNCLALQFLADASLVNKGARVIEDFALERFLDRGAFMDSNFLFIDNPQINTFTIIIPSQQTQLDDFIGRNFFLDRLSFVSGTHDSVPESVYRNLELIINNEKAVATQWRLIELS